MNDFETIERFSSKLEQKWNETAAKDDNKKSFIGLQKMIKQMRLMLQNERRDREAEYQKILENKVFTPEYVGKQRMKLDDQYNKMEENIISSLRKDIKVMTADKLRRLDHMLTEAPTPEQFALLNAIRMRGTNLSKGELKAMLPKFMRNYQAMRIFETLASAAGYKVSVPLDGDIADMYSLLDKGGDYLLECLGQVGKERPAMHGAFFFDDPKKPGNADPEFQVFIDYFDVPAQLQDFTVTKKLSEAETAMIKSYFREVDDLDPEKDSIAILRETQKIMKKHPGDIELIKRSAYKKLIAEVQELEAINAAKDAAHEQQEQAVSQ